MSTLRPSGNAMKPRLRRLGQRRPGARALRDLLGSYPTGVAIVTTRATDGRNVGLTINLRLAVAGSAAGAVEPGEPLAQPGGVPRQRAFRDQHPGQRT